MGTPLTRVFEKFLGQIDDKELLLVEDEVIEDLMVDYLESATVDFTQCRKDLSFTPPERCEVRHILEGLTSQLQFAQHGKNTFITSITNIDGTNYENGKDYTVDSEGMIHFTDPIEGTVIVNYTVDGEFVEDLELIEIRILAHGMVLHYLKPKIMTNDSLKQHVTDKDFTKLSGANMLLRLMGLEKSQLKQLDVLQGKYAFKDFKGFN